MEHPAQVRKDSIDEAPVFPNPSKLHVAKVMLKLLPVVISLRRDRREWVKREGKNVDEEKYRRHARRALKTFIELGPSYIKLGQWLSTRVDVLPQPYLEVLAKLQDDVPPAPFPEIKPTIERELGKIEEVFEEFDPAPLSGASLGQVYVAKYAGRQVIVKVGRPNIERTIEDDIYVLKKIMPLATRFIDPNLRFSAEGMLAQFIETVHEEMDYRVEANNLLTIKRNLAGDPSVIVPEVFMERTSRHVLTMEYVPGVKITDIARLDEKGIDREKLVVRAHRLFFKMLLRHNIFHADPHPGNISVADDGRLILYDFGMVGRLDPETRIRLIRLYLGLLDKDAERTVNVLIELGTLEPTVNRYIVELNKLADLIGSKEESESLFRTLAETQIERDNFLEKLPERRRIPMIDGSEILMVHGSPADPTVEITHDMEDDEILALLLGLKERGVAVIMIEHVMRAVMKFSERVAVLVAGRKIAEGDPHAIAANPEVIRAYLGE